MIAPRWRKSIRDLATRPGRSALAALALAAGVFQIGAMLYKYALLQPELNTMYGRTNPASATFVVDAVDDELVEKVRRVPGVGDAEWRPVVATRVRVGEDEWVPAVFSVVRDFDSHRIDTFLPDRGAWPPGPGDVLLERSALSVAKADVGDSITLQLEGGEEQILRVAGTVHAKGLPPAWMEHMVPGFVAWGSNVRGAGRGESAQIRVVVAEHGLDEGWIREVADSVQAMLAREGREVLRTTVPRPGRHPHADQMEAFLFLLLAFGVLSFALSTVLVASMTHALMAEQVKQVGILKAIGASNRQVAGIYLAQVGALAAVALALGIPLGLVVGRAYAQFAAGILNADVSGAPFPWWLVAAEIVVGVLVPVLVALGPLRHASRITVHEALNRDLDPRAVASAPLGAGLGWLPRPLLLSLRTTFLRRGRLALTVASLAVGGAALMAALNVASAWRGAVDRDFARRRYDLMVGLADPVPVDTLRAVLASVPQIEHAEFWPGASPYLIGPSGVPKNTVTLIGPEPGSQLLDLAVTRGRWLAADDGGVAVINRAMLVEHPGLEVGGVVTLRLNGRDVALPIVGIVRELAPMPVVYAPAAAVRRVTGAPPGLARSARIVTRRHDDAGQREAARALERAFEARGLEVRGLVRMLDQKQGILDHLVIILAILTMAATIVVLVGGLGLASTLALGVVQRTREFGVLGAIGATPGTIARHVWLEAVLVGLLSWAAACVLAAPASWALEVACGQIFLRAPLDFHFTPFAAAVWLGVVLGIATIASALPARRAARLPVREALAQG